MRCEHTFQSNVIDQFIFLLDDYTRLTLVLFDVFPFGSQQIPQRLDFPQPHTPVLAATGQVSDLIRQFLSECEVSNRVQMPLQRYLIVEELRRLGLVRQSLEQVSMDLFVVASHH